MSSYIVKSSMVVMTMLLLPLAAAACDICGAFIGITPYDNQSNIQFLHRYRSFNGYAAANQQPQLFPQGVWRTPAAYSPLHTTHGNGTAQPVYSNTDFEVFRSYELRLKYFIHRRIELNAFIPFNQNMTRSGDEKDVLTDMGDPTVYAAWHAIRKLEDVKIQQRLIIGIGSKLQFGRTALRNEKGQRYHLMLQPGTGSTDLFLYTSYTAGYKKFGLNLNAMGKINGTNKFNERIGNSVVSSVNVFARFKLNNNLVLMPSLQSYYEYSKGIYVNDVLEYGSGMNVAMAGAGAELVWKNISFQLAAHIPVHEHAPAENLSSAGRIVAGVTFNFNQQHYLFGK
ncbi:MAG: hypothetical protein IM638_18975 [Bacteroidetes bacterium]|nr:hypothetical protein [Bacteroidota bacterium]